MIGPLPVCLDCARLIQFPYCTAFGEDTEIPDMIAIGEDDHTQPHPGDHGRLFQQATLEEKRKINRIHGMPPPPADYEDTIEEERRKQFEYEDEEE